MLLKHSHVVDDFDHAVWRRKNEVERDAVIVTAYLASAARNGRYHLTVAETTKIMFIMNCHTDQLPAVINKLCRRAGKAYADLRRFTAGVTCTHSGKPRLQLTEKE